jgi:CRISPR-associated protein Cas1
MQLVIDTTGVTLQCASETFIVENEQGIKRTVSPEKITGIAIHSGDCLISAAAVHLAAEKNIPILFVGRWGGVKAILRSPHFTGLADLRRRQVQFLTHQEAASWLTELFLSKLEGQLTVLIYLMNRLPGLEQELKDTREKITAMGEGFSKMKATTVVKITSEYTSRLMGIEGSIAREYWTVLSKTLPPEWQFEGRSRQPAMDGFNALLNYGYGMTYPVVESALFAAGLDPYLGVMHADQYDSPSLAFDCIEPFRPWVDELILTQFLTDQITKDMFTVDETTGGWSLNQAGKRFWIPLFNDYIKTNCYFRDKRITRHAHIYRFAGELALRLKNMSF